ncbi:hypothetical protein [Mycobacterium sp. SMC-4]|uniref:hypothetical protein n=1 Tax=Mycobacterium sp. SMC-4 TaxID=2857059 RepID=UPI0021B271DD|nr:hypothetical protein [Mycobacterium sp. SMC-4]UXA16190.1 hypothetical protein KXD98_15200 [Mycobacterium sp. SMC-4]
MTPAREDTAGQEFQVEDITTGLHASGFGQVGDGRTFSFHVERQELVVEVYRPRLRTLVPDSDDVVAVSTRKLTDIDFTDERSLVAVVRDAVAEAQPVPRPMR